MTFIVLLAWGGFAATYTLAGRLLRSIGRRGALDPAAPATAGTLDAYRDDGPLALALGRIAPRRLPASALVLAALAVLLAVVIVTGTARRGGWRAARWSSRSCSPARPRAARCATGCAGRSRPRCA